jgi:uncharacterized C2H2 Zn-finger protein
MNELSMSALDAIPARDKSGKRIYRCGSVACRAMLATVVTSIDGEAMLRLPDNFYKRSDGSYGQTKAKPDQTQRARDARRRRRLGSEREDAREVEIAAGRAEPYSFEIEGGVAWPAPTGAIPLLIEPEGLPVVITCARCKRDTKIKDITGSAS